MATDFSSSRLTNTLPSIQSDTHALVGQDGSTVYVKLVLDGNVVSEDGNVLHTGPSPDGRVPPDDRGHDPGVIPDGGVGHDDASLEPDTRSDLGSGSDDDIGSDQRGRVDLGGL
jgi:hypothetical protein